MIIVAIITGIIFLFFVFLTLYIDTKRCGTFNDGITLGIIITLLLFTECALIICIKNALYPTAIDVYQGKTTLKYITVDGIKVDSIVVFKKDVTNLNIY